MFRLRLFGGVRLEGPNGVITGQAARRHRLALLTLLALSPSRRRSREKLIAYLWPENDASHARNLLNQSVHALRQALGREAIRSEGDELALNPGAVSCDVWSFEEALSSGDLERAVDLYVGPFAEGFSPPGSIEFERWADDERERLRRAYLGALEKLAEEASGRDERQGAAEWWRRLAAEEPTNFHLILRLMRALEAAGDRAAAIREAESHAELLRKEFDATPNPAVLDLAERMRTRPEDPGRASAAGEPARTQGDGDANYAPSEARRSKQAERSLGTTGTGEQRSERDAVTAATARKRRRFLTPRKVGLGFLVALALGGAVAARQLLWGERAVTADEERQSIAILPFANLSPDPEDAYLADGIHGEIISQLGRIASLNVTSRTSVMEYRDTNGNVRAIARELGVAHVLEGTVRYADDRVRVTAQLIDALDDEQLWAASYERDLEDIFAVQAEVAREITAALSATLTPEEGAWIARKPTDDRQAYAYYLRARTVRLETVGDLRQAIAYLDTALTLDSTFAGAWAIRGKLRLLYIRHSGQNADTISLARKDIDRALALNPDLPETHLALGYYHSAGHRDYEEALQHFRRVRRLQPSNVDAITAIGDVFLRQGRWSEAVEQFRTVVALDPRRPHEAERLALVFLLMRRYEETDRYINRALILDSTRVGPNIVKVQLELKRDGDVRGAREALENAVARAGKARILFGFLHVSARKPYVRILVDDFDRLMQDSVARARLRDWCISCDHWYTARAARAEGRPEAARAITDSLVTKFDTLRAYVDQRPAYRMNVYRFLGLHSAKLGDYERAIEAAEKGVRLLPISKDAFVGPDVLQTLADVYVLAGQHEKAIAQLDHLLSVPSELSVPVLRLDPFWDPLREHPGFQALLEKYDQAVSPPVIR